MKENNNVIYKVAAGIVLYNPDEERFMDALNSIYKQVNIVYVFLNSPCDSLRNKILYENVKFIGTGKNIGLAKALNCIMLEASKNKELEWVITMDQDSIVPYNFVESISNKFNEKDIAIICPQVIDKRRAYMIPQKSSKFEYINRCITSSSCTRIEAWNSVGRYDENLYIDLIDNDFCKRLIILNWKILRINNIILDQQYGDIERKSKWKVDIIMFISKLVKNKNLSTNIAKLTYKKNVNPQRVYFTNRNIIYLNRKFKKYGGIGYECYSCNTYLGFCITFSLASLIRGKNKIKILKAIINGIKDGKKMEVQEFLEN